MISIPFLSLSLPRLRAKLSLFTSRLQARARQIVFILPRSRALCIGAQSLTSFRLGMAIRRARVYSFFFFSSSLPRKRPTLFFRRSGAEALVSRLIFSYTPRKTGLIPSYSLLPLCEFIPSLPRAKERRRQFH